MNWGFIIFAGMFVLSVIAVIARDFVESWLARREFEEYLKRKSEEEK